MKTYLTDNGNLLHVGKNVSYFTTPTGQFLRQVLDTESDFLSGVCLEIKILNSTFPTYTLDQMPVWEPLWQTCDEDYSNYIGSMSSNGGAYADFSNHEYYISKFPDGSFKFRVLTRLYSSAEFMQDDFGNYTDNIQTLHLINTTDKSVFRIQGSGESENDVFENFSNECTMEDALIAYSVEITSPYTFDGQREYESERIDHRPTQQELDTRMDILRGFGYEFPTKRVGSNPTRR